MQEKLLEKIKGSCVRLVCGLISRAKEPGDKNNYALFRYGGIIAQFKIYYMTGGDNMKKLMSIIVSILFALSMTGLCYAQDNPVSPAPEKKVEKKVKKSKKTKKGDKPVKLS